jgi:acyl-CoA synthetase (AMP-forming)/AMP-acid ligase II
MSEKLLQTVRDYIYYNELQKPKEDFVICPHSNIKISNESLRKNLDKIHLFLTSKKNQTKGSIICTLIENSLSSIQLMLGIMYSGMIQVPLNLIAGEEQLSYVVNHSGAQILFVSSKYIDLAQKIIANVSRNIEIIEIDKNIFVDQLEGTNNEKIWKIDQDDPALLMYTSGTTGKPKGVMLSHKNILAGGKNVALSHKLKTNDRALCVLPLYHINGAVVTVLGPLVSQSSLILCERFSVTNFWKFISTFNCTWFSIVPTIISSLLNKFSAEEINSLNLSHVRFGRSASAALAPETHRQFEEKFKITMIETMGLTETCAPILSNPLPPGKIKYGSPGIPYGNKVKIVDSELQDVPRNTVGQICVKGANVMKEYYKNPEETKKSFIEDWFLTGDLAIMDSEDYVFVRGRIKELIIKGGENISPREIDDVLYQYPDVIEAAAFAMPCSHYGEKIEAGVVVKNKMSLKSEDLILHCRKYLGDFKTPSKIHFLDELPKGPSGKIQRFKIKDLI